MSMEIMGKALGTMANIAGNKEQIKDFSSAGVNKIQGYIKGCVSVPKCVENFDIYFVINQPNNSAVVNGFTLNEYDKIVNHYMAYYDYAIILLRENKRTDIKAIASGPEMHATYAGKTAGEIAKLRAKNVWTYIVCEEDVLYLKHRLEKVGGGKVLTNKELTAIANEYIYLSEHQHFSESVAIHQAIVDIAISLVK